MLGLQLAFEYLLHWIRSSSVHGLHSPFVYRLADEVIYNYHAVVPEVFSDVRPRKVTALINRIIKYWMNERSERREYILVDSDADYLKVFGELLPKTHPGTLLIFEGIYKKNASKNAWKDIIRHHQVTVGIDLFYIGLIFFREGQAKENFRIRF